MNRPTRRSGRSATAAAAAIALVVGVTVLSGMTASSLAASTSALFADALPAPPMTTTPSPDCGWNLTAQVVINTGQQHAHGISAISASDVWAVGQTSPSQYVLNAFSMHWDGTSWAAQPVPPVGHDGKLRAVHGLSANDVWAVGTYSTDAAPIQGVTYHWDGQQWNYVPSPNPTNDTELDSVAMVATNDVWAVGAAGTGGPTGGSDLVLHWDGSTWSVAPAPNGPRGPALLSNLKVIAPDDIWAVGHELAPDGISWLDQTFTIHWDGQQWNYVPSPNRGDSLNFLFGVDAAGSNDVWAVGYWYDQSIQQFSTLTMHWDGATWTIVPSPNLGIAGNYLNAVAVSGPHDAWAVGQTFGRSPRGALLLHWDGAAWSLIDEPQPAGHNDGYDIVALQPNDVWLAGDNYNFNGAGRSLPLIGHYSGPCGTATPASTGAPPSATPSRTATSTRTQTGTPTGTPSPSRTATGTGTPTGTSMPSTGTLTNTPTNTSTQPPPTATPCAIKFSDVLPGSTFYPYIHCLACRGIVSGYADGTFQPNNNVTRGQLSKIVSNAAGFSEAQPNQMFQDVAVGSTFQLYIGRLASRGYIGGYACGGPGEPCNPPGNLPYFRPGNNATRGQITKIVSNAAGYNDTPTGQQFEDVAVGSTYYTFTYRLVSRTIMSGYPCSGPGEPCVPPGNLPYFRPNNNATRGQTSKIVANTFFQGCSQAGR